jgi:HEAT repeat protein
MRSLDARISAALAAYDEETRWELIAGIMDECPDDVFEASTGLVRGEHERERTLGADILGRLVGTDPEAGLDVERTLLPALQNECAPHAIASMVAALGHVGDANALPQVIPLARHPDAGVRLAVAFAVTTISPRPLSDEVKLGLIRLSRDEDPEVRDWATFGLGTLSIEESPEVTAALLARASDPYHEARAEALFGLAVRRDPRAVPHLIRALASAQVQGREVDAAAEAADPRLLPALWALQGTGLADEGRVRRAIDRCSGRDSQALLS